MGNISIWNGWSSSEQKLWIWSSTDWRFSSKKWGCHQETWGVTWGMLPPLAITNATPWRVFFWGSSQNGTFQADELFPQMEVPQNRWMVFERENPMNKWMMQRGTPKYGTPHMSRSICLLHFVSEQSLDWFQDHFTGSVSIWWKLMVLMFPNHPFGDIWWRPFFLF